MTDQPPQPYDHEKWLHEMKRIDGQRAIDRWDNQFDKLNEAAVKIADATLRAGMLINGGAAVSVLAFIGSLATKELITVTQLSLIASSLVIFALGVVAAVLGMGLSYMTHFFGAGRIASFTKLSEHPWIIPGRATRSYTNAIRATHILAFAAGLVCIVFFVWGMISVRNAIEHLGATVKVIGAN
jgi:hypothetical protein